MLKSLSKREIVRTSAKKSRRDDRAMHYAGCYTLEPGMVLDAWDTLTEDTFGLDLAYYPVIIHNGFISEMRKRIKHGE